MFEGTHAIVYCATGSHGMWPDTGRHEYLKLSNGYTLVDQASSGTSWYTWEYLKPVQYDPSGQYSGDFKFWDFRATGETRNTIAASSTIYKSSLESVGLTTARKVHLASPFDRTFGTLRVIVLVTSIKLNEIMKYIN